MSERHYTASTEMNPVLAAYHESAHAVACVVMNMPLQDTGIHIDTIGGGITFNFHRKPGDLTNTPADIVERERSIVMIKAGYMANLKLSRILRYSLPLMTEMRRKNCWTRCIRTTRRHGMKPT